MFVNHDPVAVTLDNENIIYIRPKMDLGTLNQVLGEMAQLGEDGKVRLDVGAYLLELAVANIVRWEGPAFEGIPCTSANIRRLDPGDPLVDAVVEEIAQRNPQHKPAKN